MSAIKVMTEPFQRTSYTFSTIAETGEQFSDFAPYVASIDDRGVVAFQTTLQDGGSGVFTGDGGPITVIADSSTGLFREVSSHPDLDGRGSVCLQGDPDEPRLIGATTELRSRSRPRRTTPAAG